MHKALVTIQGTSNYSQSKVIDSKKRERETHQTFEERTWRERMHVDGKGRVIIPPMAIKNTLVDAAKFLSIQIPGRNKNTYTKHFEAGVLCVDQSVIRDASGGEILAKNVEAEWLFVPADGKRGGDRRVMKAFPLIQPDWTAQFEVHVFDELITKAVFLHHLTRAGQFIGLGRFRPRRNGYYGRFVIRDLAWTTINDAISEEEAA